MMYSTTNEPTATIHARILSRHDAVKELESKQYQSHSITSEGQEPRRKFSVHFQYLDEETGEFTLKTFDGRIWS